MRARGLLRGLRRRTLARLAPLLWRGQLARWRITRPITVGVKVLLVREGRVVLVRHTYQRGWHLPGGALERGETLGEAARREAEEEVGATVQELELFGAFSQSRRGKSDHIVVFVTREFDLRPADSWEIAEISIAPVDQLPRPIGRGTRARIEEYVSGKWPRHGEWLPR